MIRAASDAKTSTRTRRNKSATIERLDRFYNIDQGLVPFQRSSGSYSNKSTLSVRDAVILCQKAYWNSAIFRNTIDLMTEFSCSDVYFTGGSKKTRDFFAALLKKLIYTVSKISSLGSIIVQETFSFIEWMEHCSPVT